MVSHTGSVKILGGQGQGGGKHVCSDGGLISTLPAPEFGQGSI